MPFNQYIRARAALFLGALLTLLLLSGCSGMRLVDSDVTAFSAWSAAPPGPNTPYRFERLPSQLAPNAEQDRVEAAAVTSLSKVGMSLNAPTARYSVQVVAATEVLQRYADSGFGWGGPGVFIGGGSFGGSVGLSFPFGFSTPYYKRSVTVLMRELATQKVVFETDRKSTRLNSSHRNTSRMPSSA